jgi:hypothetical protein
LALILGATSELMLLSSLVSIGLVGIRANPGPK